MYFLLGSPLAESIIRPAFLPLIIHLMGFISCHQNSD